MRITAVRTVVAWGPRRPAYGSASRPALGLAVVPAGPGLGVELDPDVLDRWRRNAPPDASA